jgi:predicted Zn-dependent protease with MMP-like domain
VAEESERNANQLVRLPNRQSIKRRLLNQFLQNNHSALHEQVQLRARIASSHHVQQFDHVFVIQITHYFDFTKKETKNKNEFK